MKDVYTVADQQKDERAQAYRKALASQVVASRKVSHNCPNCAADLTVISREELPDDLRIVTPPIGGPVLAPSDPAPSKAPAK